MLLLFKSMLEEVVDSLWTVMVPITEEPEHGQQPTRPSKQDMFIQLQEKEDS